ncbi:MAG: hypothetical protein CM1200mP41_36140 [Gammaproteobacteria bacterium]|nr:MAG: hypothetical protein CM1200mP41_36140 [Gammaproteobacteria bacterium]
MRVDALWVWPMTNMTNRSNEEEALILDTIDRFLERDVRPQRMN